MRVEREWLRQLVFDLPDTRRFTQDSPILPEVWLSGGVAWCRAPDVRVDLLLTPHKDSTASTLARTLLDGLEALAASGRRAVPPLGRHGRLGHEDDAPLTKPTWTVSVNQTTVAASLTFHELIACALPLSLWWQQNILQAGPVTPGLRERDRVQTSTETAWMRRLVGTIACAAEVPTRPPARAEARPDDPWVATQTTRRLEGATVADYQTFCRLLADEPAHEAAFSRWVEAATERDAAPTTRRGTPLLFTVALNRQSVAAISRSVAATKADAARRVFDIKCTDLAWAVLDTGIDARHRAFRVADPSGASRSRVRATYDFTRLRPLLSLDSHPSTGPTAQVRGTDLEEADRRYKQMRRRLRSGQALDWAELEPMIDISLDRPHSAYTSPAHDHGTHVAGILAAHDEEKGYVGVCRDLALYDFRVLDAHGRGEEFEIIAALQFIRFLNARADQPVIHGVNLSLSLLHDVENFACGRSPICEECERLVASGVVVVAAAGNRGYERALTAAGEIEAYRAISITDPGNADGVITVGATHRFQPHTYGVSYFSSRGPTGDGRAKPDLLGPGERVYSTLPNDQYGAKDGTSMAAPHVSGVAALLMARHREFIGQPARVKQILVSTATDLGRERYFQGAGMVDALRALQSV